MANLTGLWKGQLAFKKQNTHYSVSFTSFYLLISKHPRVLTAFTPFPPTLLFQSSVHRGLSMDPEPDFPSSLVQTLPFCFYFDQQNSDLLEKYKNLGREQKKTPTTAISSLLYKKMIHSSNYCHTVEWVRCCDFNLLWHRTRIPASPQLQDSFTSINVT